MTSWSLPQLYIQNYLIVASIGIVYYDYFITFDDEQRYMWKRWRYAGSWLFFVNRYFTFFSSITWIGSFLPWDSVQGILQSCSTYSLYRQVITGVIEFIVILNMFFRVFALYGKDTRVLGLGLLVFLIMVGIGVWGFSGDSSPTILLSPGCHIVISTGAKFAAAWAGLLVADVLIFGLTFFKTYTAIRGPRANSGSLSALMFKDGVIYYITLTCLNLANLLTFYVLPHALQGCLASIVGSISSVLLSRMMLNLHKSVAMNGNAVLGENFIVTASLDFLRSPDMQDPV